MSSNVVPIWILNNPDIDDHLGKLCREAESGEISGIVYCVLKKGGQIAIGAGGILDPDTATAGLVELLHYLSELS